MKKIIPMLLFFTFFISCKKTEIIFTADMIKIADAPDINSAIQSIEIPNPNGCGSGTYQSLIYDGNSCFMLRYGYDGYNLNYVSLSTWSGPYKWSTDHTVWGYDHMGGQIYGQEYYTTPMGGSYFNTSIEFTVIPNSCIVHYTVNHNPRP